MKGIDIGKDKVKKICDVLKKETLEPARKEADEIVQQAEAQAKQIIKQAEKEAENRLQASLKEIEKERNVFQSSLNQACKQAMEVLKQDIEDKLFQPEIAKLLHAPLQEPRVIASLITAVINALGKEGLNADFDVIIPREVPPKEINDLLAQSILQKLKNGSVAVGPIQGGIAVKIEDNKMTIDVTEESLKELVSGYIRKDFREILFRS